MTTYTIPSDMLFGDLVEVDTMDKTVYAAMHAIAIQEIGDDRDIDDSLEEMVADYWDGSGLYLVRVSGGSLLLKCMHDFFGRDKYKHMINNFYLGDDGDYYMSHGCGYDWIDKDLLGGSGDGAVKKRFIDSIKITVAIDQD